MHGAIQEANHVFINAGLKELEKSKQRIAILEVGFGTGLNALLTCLNCKSTISYTGVESLPISDEIIQNLNYNEQIENSEEIFSKIHNTKWESKETITESFSLKKIKGCIQNIDLIEKFDLIYFDAFGPNFQSEMWNIDLFEKLYNSLSNNGVFVTYCAKGQVRRDLQSVGFTVERLNGPPGKREMLRGKKNLNYNVHL